MRLLHCAKPLLRLDVPQTLLINPVGILHDRRRVVSSLSSLQPVNSDALPASAG